MEILQKKQQIKRFKIIWVVLKTHKKPYTRQIKKKQSITTNDINAK
jgi:hypothetical protein